MKKLLSILLLLAMLTSTCLLFASCDKSGLEFSLNSDGQSYTCLGFKDGKEAAEAIIPETYKDLPVTAIAGKAFSAGISYNMVLSGETGEDKVPLTSVTIPESVVEIGNQAFYGCKSLTSITLPSKLQSIGSEAFCRAGISGSLVIPNTVNMLGMGAFSECNSLTSVTLSSSLERVANSAFYNCTGLTSVTIPGEISISDVSAFKNCTSLTKLVIPEGVTSIAYDSFEGCSSLKDLTLPDSLNDWSRSAFSGCDLEYEVYEGGNYIGNWLFYMNDRENITTFNIKEGTVGIMDNAFSGCEKMKGAIIIPDSVKIIASQAFYNCPGITSVYIPDSVEVMGRDAFAEWYPPYNSINRITLTINCEAEEKPERWNGNWYYSSYGRDSYYTINWGISN